MRLSLLTRLSISAVAAGLLIPTPVAASSADLIGLERELSTLVAARSGEYGIAALDLRDGSTLAVNGDIPFPMASTIKIAIAAAYLAKVDQGQRSLGDTILGRPATKVLELMIVRSDNRAADQVLADVGGPVAVQQWLASQRITGIRVDRTIAQLLRERGHLADSRDVATPVGMITLCCKNSTVAPCSRRKAAHSFSD